MSAHQHAALEHRIAAEHHVFLSGNTVGQGAASVTRDVLPSGAVPVMRNPLVRTERVLAGYAGHRCACRSGSASEAGISSNIARATQLLGRQETAASQTCIRRPRNRGIGLSVAWRGPTTAPTSRCRRPVHSDGGQPVRRSEGPAELLPLKPAPSHPHSNQAIKGEPKIFRWAGRSELTRRGVSPRHELSQTIHMDEEFGFETLTSAMCTK